MTPPALRAGRRLLAASIAWLVYALPSLEPEFVRLGRAARRRSRLLAGLYWSAQERLVARLRRRGEPYRSVLVLGRRLQLDITDATDRILASAGFHAHRIEPGAAPYGTFLYLRP